MVESQHRLVREKFGITHLLAVSGASMGGMQTLQWGVSHPEMMTALIALTPMAKTPAWSVAVNEATRKALTADAEYNNGNYIKQPEKGWRVWTDVLLTLATRTPDGLKAEYPKGLDVVNWIKGFEDTWAEEWLRRERLDLADLGLRSSRCRDHGGLQWRHRQGTWEHKSEGDPDERSRGSLQSDGRGLPKMPSTSPAPSTWSFRHCRVISRRLRPNLPTSSS
jgi:pimeloyl-ACP methyl ester carboxylesterase